MKRNLLVTISYDGSAFSGWQNTGEKRSVEGVLKKVLEQFFNHPIDLQAASRTDAGVHAKEQSINFFTDHEKYSLSEITYRLNCLLPKDLVIQEITEKTQPFHPTIDAVAKTYCYQVCTKPFMDPFDRNYYWHFPYELDFEKMTSAAGYLEGTHDFSAFCNQREDLIEKDKTRTLYSIKIRQDRNHYSIYLTGNRFLYRMARNLVGTLCYIGAGKLSIDDLPNMLSKNSNRKGMGMTAPAHGLFLEKVHYHRNFAKDLL